MHKFHLQGRTTLLLKLFSLMLIVLVSCNKHSKVKVLRLAHGLDEKHPVHQGMAFMAEKLAEESGGKLMVKIFSGGQLGGERQCLELLQIGSLDMTKVSSAVLEGFAPKYQVLGLPYIFRDKAHAHKVFDGPIGKELLDDGDKYWLKGLCFYDAGARSFYSIDKPILTPNDLDGMKIRVMKSNTAVEMVSAFGGSPTPISWGELYTSLQQGVVDGAENNPPSFYTSHHFEVCKHYAINEHTSVPDVLLINLQTWNKLSSQEKEWLQKAVAKSVIEQRKLWETSEKYSLEQVQKAGVKIYYPDKQPFMDKVEKMHASFAKDERFREIIEKIKATE